MITPSFGLTATERVLPKLSLDFTTASLDSRISFTRATGASNPATYVNSSGYVTAATNNEPRFDHDPVTLVCKGLLIEEARTNLLLESSGFDQPSWIKTEVSVVTNAIISPDGTLNGAKLVENTASGVAHQLNQSVSVSSGIAYTISIYAKSAERTALFIRAGASAFGTLITASYNLTAKTATVITAGTQTNATITLVGNGWYRCTLTSTTVAATSPSFLIGLENPAGTRIYAGDGTSGLYIWGAQLEAGAFATSYIPTTTTALTRNADVAVMTGTNFSDWFNASEGTLVAQALIPQVAQSSALFCVSDGTSAERIQLRKSTTQVVGVVVDNNASQASITAGTWTSTTAAQIGTLGYKLNSFACATNGSTLGTDNTGTIPTVTQAEIGFGQASTYANGWIQKLSYYPQRLTDAEIRAFSK